jgi:uncharacterized protein YciI
MATVHAIVMSLVTLLVPASVEAQRLPDGFETYLVGLMTRGPGDKPVNTAVDSLQKAHLEHLDRMWAEGLLVASGPIARGAAAPGDLRGVLIFRGDRTLIEQRVADDPLVRTGQLRVTLKPWMGPAEIGAEYKKWTAANPGAADQMRTYQLVLMRPAPMAAPMTPGEQRDHLTNMDAMVKAGHLIVAGPILEPGDLAGIFVFDTDAAQADKLAATDPAVVAKKMVVERYSWMVADRVLPKGFKVPLP